MMATRKPETQTTTVRLPRRLYEQAKKVVETGGSPAGSFNELLISALRDHLRQLRRKQIDAAFAGMAVDRGYTAEAARIENEFAASDWETLHTSGDSDSF
jgi:hypothetical protein